MKVTDKARRSARRLFVRCLVDGRLDTARVRLVARRIADARRRRGLAVLTDFRRLVRLDRDRHTAVVQSATTLTGDAVKAIIASLAQIYGPGLETRFIQNADLIAGLYIKVGGDVYDGSVRGRLAAIEERL